MSSDDRLVERVIDGDDTAFELLYARHVADALAFAAGVLDSREEAEEAVRHSFAAAHAYLAGGGRRTAFEPWLYAILENHCLSVLQRRAPEADDPERLATVVDLDEWRAKRKLIGFGLPFVPSAGFRESVMSACGIGGGGAASAAAPLLGGTVAKVAVVTLLAGGAGVAGTAVSDRGGPGDMGASPSPIVADSSQALLGGGLASRLSWPDDRAEAREPVDRPRRRVGDHERKSPDDDGRRSALPELPNPQLPVAGVVGEPDYVAPLPSPPPASPGVGVPAADVPAATLPTDDAADALRRLGERVKQGLPTLEERLKAGLPRVGGDPGAEPPVARRPLLPGTRLPEVELPDGVELPSIDLPVVAEPPPVGDDGPVPVAPPA